MQELRKLELRDKNQLEQLIEKISINLENEFFWLPITDESREHFFDDKWTYFLGMFEKEKLIAAVGLFLNKNEYEESAKKLQLQDKNIAEIGRAMVLPEYRNNGYMKQITKELVKYAEGHGIKYLVATAHPQNIPSQKALEALGMIRKGSCIKQGKYERDIFFLKNDEA